MKQLSVAFCCGILFGLGLSLSRMIDPNKVQNFLDVGGQWDASLLFVMLGALPVALLGFRFILRCPTPILDTHFQLSQKTVIDKPLIIGSVIFGIGWGLSGYCPGPAVAGLGGFSFESIVMIAAMVAGFFSYRYLFERH